MATEKTPNVPALERGMEILELVANSKNGFTFSQLARQLDFPKSSVHCLLVTFERLGYLQRIASSGRYVAGMNLMRMANTASHGILLRQKAGPLLAELTQRTGLTAHMAIVEDNEAVLIAKVEPCGTSPVATWVGKHIDCHCTSLGKALLAWRSEEQVADMVKRRRMLRHNENTICTLARLKEDLARTRQCGYSLDDEEEEIGVRCIGAPLFGTSGDAEAAISISGSVEQISDGNMARLASLVQETAFEMSLRLGWSPHPFLPETRSQSAGLM
jgi:DNA-binding IclR family transcriptional regulator